MHLRARVDMAPPTTTHVTLGLYFAFVWDLPCKVFLSLYVIFIFILCEREMALAFGGK